MSKIVVNYKVNGEEWKKYKVKDYIWHNKNELLSKYKYAISGKIGFTKSSGPVFVSSAKKHGKTLVIASINESDKFELHKRLYEENFKKYNFSNKFSPISLFIHISK